MITIDPFVLVVSVALGFLAGMVSIPDLVQSMTQPVGQRGRTPEPPSPYVVGRLTTLLEVVKGMVATLIGWAVALWLGDPDGLTRAAIQSWPENAALLGVLTAHYYTVMRQSERLNGTEALGVALGGVLLVMPLLVPVGIGAVLVGMLLFWLLKGFRDAIPGLLLMVTALPVGAWTLYHLQGTLVMAAFALIAWVLHGRQLGQLLTTEYGLHPDFKVHVAPARPTYVARGPLLTPDDIAEEEAFRREGLTL